MAYLEMYSTDACDLCESARAYLATHPEILVVEVKLTQQPERDALYDKFGISDVSKRLMPQFVLIEDGKEQPLGGWNDVRDTNLHMLFA